MPIVISPAAEGTLLHVGAAVYEALLAESGESSHARLAYTGAILEIVSPSKKHEVYNRLLETLVREVARAWNIELLVTGSVTLRVPPHGAEADSSFHVGERAARLRAKETIDLTTDGAPDIIVEIDISRERVDKKARYANLRSPSFGATTVSVCAATTCAPRRSLKSPQVSA